MTDVAFDAQASDVDGSFSLTNSDAGNAILVSVRDSAGGSAITSVTYGAASLTKLGFIGSHNGSDGVALWGKIGGLPTGANTLIANNSPQWSGACTYKNPGSFGTVFTSFNPDSGGDTSGSVVITGTVTGGFCVSGTAFGASNSPIATSPATLRWVEAADSNSGSGNGWMIDKVSAGGGASTTIAWTNTTADWSGVIGVEIKPGSGAISASGAVKLKKMKLSVTSTEGVFKLVGTNNSPAEANPFSLVTVNTGDIIPLAIVTTGSSTVTGVSGGGCSWSQIIAPISLSSVSGFGCMWLGTVVTPGTSNVTLTFSGSAPSVIRPAYNEFSISVGNANDVVLDTSNSLNGNTNTWPTLTPSKNGELYWGYCKDNASASAGSTPGFAYQIDSNANGRAFNSNVSSAVGPVWGDSTQTAGIMALFKILISSTGAVKLKKMKVAASSGNASFVTGAVKLKKMKVVGSGAEKTIGTGAVKLKKTKVVGSSAEKTVATGAVKLKKMKTGVVNTHPFATAIAGSGTGQHFVDQHGAPFFLRADTVWALPQLAGLSGGATTWNSDIDTYCLTRAEQGFNSFLITAVGNSVSSSTNGNNNGETWDGVAPFNSPGVLNETYWQRVDYIINQAATNGLTVVVNIAMQYSMDTSGCAFESWTDANYEAYGTAIGTRYASALNIIWTVADDYFGNMDGFYTDIKTNIQSAGDTHLWSIENFAESTSRHDISDDTELTWGSTSGIDYNYVYSYGPSYLGIEYAYQESSPICVIHGDGYYDGDGGGSELKFLRNFVWWTLSDATRGFIYGRENIWSWSSSALGHLTDGLFDASGLQTAWNAFTALPGWHTLVPDLSSSLVTAGRGTRATQIASGGSGHEYVPSDTQNTYVTASLAPDGSLAVVYIPAANSTTITVDDTQLASGYTAKWLDPANGATTSATTGSTYTRSTANSAGDHDWVLVFSELTSSVGTGAVKLKKMVVSGSSAEKTVSTGAVKLKKMVVSSSSTEKTISNAIIRLKKMVVSGSSSEKTSSSGAVKLKKMVVSGSSAEKTVTAGAVKLKKMVIRASSTRQTSLSGSVSLKKMVVSGSITEKSVVTAVVRLKKMRVSGSSIEKTIGVGNVHLHKMRVSASSSNGEQQVRVSPLFIFSPL